MNDLNWSTDMHRSYSRRRKKMFLENMFYKLTAQATDDGTTQLWYLHRKIGNFILNGLTSLNLLCKCVG
jgi:hypothetical protein